MSAEVRFLSGAKTICLRAQLEQVRSQFAAVRQAIEQVIVGKSAVIERLLVAIAARGHVLLKDVPGTGKTLLAKTLAAAISCDFRRIQFVPDLLPMDITGCNLFDIDCKSFVFQPGPVFTDVLLADEINRATPKTQSALLEVMEEQQVSVEGVSHRVAQPFTVLATMNPLDHHGTYALPAAQLDRFMMMLSVGYPDEVAELKMLEIHLAAEPALAQVRPCIDRAQLLRWQALVPFIFCAEEVKRYAVSIANALRGDAQNLQSISPRATLALLRAAQSHAMFAGRDHVNIDDVRQVAPDVYAHRVLLADAGAAHDVVERALGQISIPG